MIMWYIVTEDNEYHIIGKSYEPDNVIGRAVNDCCGDPITDIDCYTITETNDDYKIKVDHKKWLMKKANDVI